MFDTHTHLLHRSFRNDRELAYERAVNSGVSMMLEVGWDLRSSGEALRFAERHDGVWVAVGCHPHDSKNAPSNYLKEFEVLARHDKVKAIGEIGLDYYRDLSPRPLQRRVFIEQIELAEGLNLPMVIHCRDAMSELLPLVAERGYHRGVFHSLAADEREVERILELGFFVGINGTLTYNGKRTKRWLTKVPKERLLIETDCPYLTPEPHRRERNEPSYVRYVAEAVANQLGMSFEEVTEITESNGKRLFGGES